MKVVDARGLEPPEPFQRVMDAVIDLQAGESLRFHVDRVPHPLFRILARDGYAFEYRLTDDGTIEVDINMPS